MATSADFFQSKHLAAADLRDSEVTVVMGKVMREEVGRDKDICPVLYFHGKEKGMVLNRTNWNTIAKTYGDESNNWDGKRITLYPTETTNLRGETVPCIRVRPPRGGVDPQAPAPAPRQSEPVPNVKRDFDDEIPF